MATRHLRREDEAPHNKRPHNREVEDEMIRAPRGENQPPRPATEPHKPDSKSRPEEPKP